MTYFKVDIIESERGWGRKIDSTLFFKTEEDAIKFCTDYNKSNVEDYAKTKTVPDWYMQAETPSLITDALSTKFLDILFNKYPEKVYFTKDEVRNLNTDSV